jgi:hypothetical protein
MVKQSARRKTFSYNTVYNLTTAQPAGAGGTSRAKIKAAKFTES